MIKLDLFDGGKTAHFTTTFFGEHFPVVYSCQGWFNERTPAPVRYYFRADEALGWMIMLANATFQPMKRMTLLVG